MSTPDSHGTIRLVEKHDLAERIPLWTAYLLSRGETSLSRCPGWLRVLERSMGHQPYCLEAAQEPVKGNAESRASDAPEGADSAGTSPGDLARVVGILPLAYVRSLLFGRFLVGLPYLNVGGVLADNPTTAKLLVDQAVELADRLQVRYLELRHETPLEHPRLGDQLTSKVLMRLPLPQNSEELWKSFDPKVRNQVRKGQRMELEVQWGGAELLREFYAVFSHNMRDLGTPAFPRRLFQAVLEEFPDRAELCVVRLARKPVAGALLVHGPGLTEVPSASSLRRYNPTCANMLMYWHLLCRAIERQQKSFDFGRSTVDSPTYRFKKQWGAEPVQTTWQYYRRHGSIHQMRPDSGRFGVAIRVWRHLPVWLTRILGPWIVRGIP